MFTDKSNIQKVALYTRVSTDEQAESGFSLDAQLDKLRKFAELNDYEIVKEYVDGGYSGRNTRRPQYQQMIMDLAGFDAIVVLKMDRIHRNSKNFMEMMDQLKQQDKQFVSMQEKLDTSTAMGRFVMDILQRIAQLESEQIGERVFVGMIQKAKKAENFIGHRIPFGYKWDNIKQRFIPQKEKLEIIKKCFELYLDGESESIRGIGKKLGISHVSVNYYLHNCFYAGMERYCHYFRRVEGLDPLVTVEVFNQVQERMQSRSCSHKQNHPLIIKDKENFQLSKEQVKNIPIINRARHRYEYG